MPTLNLGRVRLNARGAYDNSASYEPLDVVSINGSSYFCRLPVQGVQPGTSGADSYWQFLVGVLGELDLANTVLITGSGEDGLVDSLDKRIIYVDTVADMQALAGYPLKDNQQIHVKNVGMFSYENGSFVPQSVNVQTGDSFPSPAVKDQLFILEPDGLYYYNGNEWVALINIDLLQSKVNEAEAFADAAESQADRAAQEVNDGIVTGIASGVEQVSTIVSAEADRAELQADRAELQADRAEGEVADGINLGVSQVTEFATEEADRAEAARDAAFVNADVYDDVAAGIAGTDEGEQFQVVEGDELVRYRNESGSEVEVARYPSVEFVESVAEGVAATSNAAIDLASQPGLVCGEFYVDDKEQSLYAITDEDGNALASWDQEGFQEIQTRGEFHTDDGQPSYAMTDVSDNVLLNIDENAQLQQPFISEFHTEDRQPSFAWTDKNGVVFYGIDEDGRNAVGGGSGVSEFYKTQLAAAGGQLWRDGGYAKIAKSWDGLYAAPEQLFGQGYQAVYSEFDELMGEFTDYISSSVVALDDFGNEIREYIFTPPSLQQTNGYAGASIPRSKIVLIGGTHGSEQLSRVTNIAVMRDVCKNWQTDKRLGSIRFGCEIVVIPVLSPSGAENVDRVNGNGVNINRNMPAGWGSAGSSDPDSHNYRGPSAGSEVEAQVVVDLLARHSNATAFIDHHGYNMWAKGSVDYVCWIGSNGANSNGVALNWSEHMTQFAKRELEPLGVRRMDDNSSIVRFSDSLQATVAYQLAQNETGALSFLLETPRFNWTDTLARSVFNAECLLELLWLIHNRTVVSRTPSIEIPLN